jgi:hypothetical protein
VIRSFPIVAATPWLAISCRNDRRDFGPAPVEAANDDAEEHDVLCVCSVCSKVAVHTYRHFSPPPRSPPFPDGNGTASKSLSLACRLGA